MAPDLNAVAAGERWDYSKPGSSGYNVPEHLTMHDPQNRKMRVLTIGAGVSGIMMAHMIQKECGNVEHVIYEKNADIGGMSVQRLSFHQHCANSWPGTWLENRYPGIS